MTVQMIGGEMLLWSDMDDPVRGAALAPLVAAATGRVLVAGPHHPDLFGTDVTHDFLVRGVPDATALAGRFGSATVWCGGPEKLTGRYDTVLALDGVGRLSSVEGIDADVGHLAAVLAPGGRLMLGAANPLGVHRLAAAPGDEPADARWCEPDPVPAPALGQSAVLAAFPHPTTPAVVLSAGLLADPRYRGFAEAAVARAGMPGMQVARAGTPGMQVARAGTPGDGRPGDGAAPAAVLDPVRLAVDAVRQGVAVALAPGWISGAPECCVVDGRMLTPGADGTWPVPEGRTLLDHVVAAARRRDMPRVRTLLTRWRGGPAAGVPAGQVLIMPDDDLVALSEPGGEGAALMALAADLMRGGHATAWPAPDGETGLARTLAAMTGVDLPDGALPPPPPLAARADLVAQGQRLSRRVAALEAKLAWFENALTDRDAALARAYQVNRVLAGKPVARAGAAAVEAVRLLRRALRRR
ncbi:hypothetical protein [Mangrovihabitans endophyticus]|uniref:Uncharacterized protein n=1 Tax=Mangrovihabitans endophyticus TaxID=1751298 RepID=A0A8J3C4Z5_9ACTN|nr:hypothetical protein [Mangrovihabitans endophyticus]GGL19374.1 hypothetical protein GCM10012284_62390 [Mangrovihabitans endophyticus]